MDGLAVALTYVDGSWFLGLPGVTVMWVRTLHESEDH